MESEVNVIQINPTVGAVNRNTKKIIEGIQGDVFLNVAPELSLMGYPPRDILTREELYDSQKEAIDRVSDSLSEDNISIVGGVDRKNGFLYNTAFVIDSKGVKHKYYKNLLPTYDVFDEARYFRSDTEPLVFEHKSRKIGVTICEDAWSDVDSEGVKQHSRNPIDKYKDSDIDLMVNISASPFRINKPEMRVRRFKRHSEKVEAPIVFVNQVGANDSLVFDGNSFIINKNNVLVDYPSFCEIKTNHQDLGKQNNQQYLKEAVEIGIEDYFRKTSNKKALIGMSGGIDSSVAAVATAKAIGKQNVFGVSLPTKISSQQSIRDARTVAENLGINFEVIEITEILNQFQSTFSNLDYKIEGLAAENLQARIRGVLLMLISNRINNSLVITPDNKSEGSVGYCTLYGDTVGAIAPLGDMYKNKVYDLARIYNTEEKIIPDRILEKQPTAELREGQKDKDDIPEYEDLDQFLDQYIEKNREINSIQTDMGSSTVESIVNKIHNSEFKRNQSPIVIRISSKDLDRGWKYPIAADYGFLFEN